MSEQAGKAEGGAGSERIADALVLCMTRGMSLEAWRESGVLSREWAIYQRLAPYYGRIVVYSYGGAEEGKVAASLGASVVANANGSDPDRFNTEGPRAVCEHLRSAGVRTVVVKTNQFEGGSAAVAITRELRAAGMKASLLARGGYIWSRFEAWKHGPGSDQAKRAAGEEGDLCRCSDLVVTTTLESSEELGWRYNLPRDRVSVVPNYVLDDAFALQGQERAPATAAVLLSAGRLDKQKRFEALIVSAASRVASKKSGPFVVRIIGDGPERQALAVLAKSLNVSLELPGRMNHAALLNELATCTAYVQCSEFEGHPKTVIEAMATGAPVVVTDTPGLSDLVLHEMTGLRADRFGSMISNQIDRLLGDDALKDRLGRGAADWARLRFSLNVVFERECDIHRLALRNLEESCGSSSALGAVRWDSSLLRSHLAEQRESWSQSISGFARRLPPAERAKFLLSLDDPIYQLQGAAAIEADGGLHPKHRLMRYHDFFVERVKPGEKVIDLGSGVGALAASIAQRSGASVVGVELAEKNIEQAKRIAAEQGVAARVRYERGDITSHRAGCEDTACPQTVKPWHPSAGSFDVIVLSNVLEHMKERPALLRKWFEWYGAKRILIRVPAFDRDWKVAYKKELGVEWRLDDTHELEYTEETLRAELSEAGLEVTELVARWGEFWLSARPGVSDADWARVKMLVLDFDGVMSNNQVLVMQDATEGVLCNRSDGLGLEMLRKAGFPVMVLSKEKNPVVGARCAKLKIECVQGIDDKTAELTKIAAARGIALGDIAYVGNDTNDLGPMGIVGLPIAVADADPRCIAAARWVTGRNGGWGAVREVCERVMGARKTP